MISDALKISGLCLILLSGVLGLLSFFTDSPDLNITLRQAGSAGEWRGIATLDGKRLLLAIFGAASFASGITLLVGGLILSVIGHGRDIRDD